MKNSISAAATMLLFLVSISLSGQTMTTATWKGGAPGRPNDWNCAGNWAGNRIPCSFSEVLIPAGVAFYPVITNTVEPVDALFVQSSATLTVEEGGHLAVLGETGRYGGLTNTGNIMNSGTFKVLNLSKENMASLKNIQGPGIIECDSASIAKN